MKRVELAPGVFHLQGGSNMGLAVQDGKGLLIDAGLDKDAAKQALRAAEVTPVRSIDGITVGQGRRGPVTAHLQEQFLGIARGQLEDRFGWLTAVSTPEPVDTRGAG